MVVDRVAVVAKTSTAKDLRFHFNPFTPTPVRALTLNFSVLRCAHRGWNHEKVDFLGIQVGFKVWGSELSWEADAKFEMVWV